MGEFEGVRGGLAALQTGPSDFRAWLCRGWFCRKRCRRRRGWDMYC